MIITPIFFPDEDRGLRSTNFLDSIVSWKKYLHYSGKMEILAIHDGDPPNIEWPTDIRVVSHPRKGLGASLNLGLKIGYECTDYVLHIVDDFQLLAPYDLDPWVELLYKREDIGSINLSAPFPGCRGTITPFGTKDWGVILDRHNLAAGLRPTLYQRRFFEYYGEFEEGINAWECEKIFNQKFHDMGKGPEVVVALPFPWSVESTIETGQITP